MAEEKDLKFKVSADTRELEDALKKLKKGLDQTEDSTESLNEEMEQTEKAGGKAAGAFADMAAKAVIVYQAVGAITDAIASFEVQAGVINRFTGDISNASDRVNGLATEVELMATHQMIANRGLQLGTKDMGNFAVAVQEYAAGTGKDAVAVQEEFAEALGTGSREALNKFGIQIGEVTSIQDAQTKALAALEKKYGDVSSSADTLAGELGTLKNRLNDVAVTMGTAVSEALESSKAIDILTGSLGEAGDSWGGLTTGIQEGVGAITGLFNAMIEKAHRGAIVVGEFAEVLEAMKNLDFAQTKRELADVVGAAARFTDLNHVVASMVDGMNKATMGAGELAKGMDTVIGSPTGSPPTGVSGAAASFASAANEANNFSDALGAAFEKAQAIEKTRMDAVSAKALAGLKSDIKGPADNNDTGLGEGSASGFGLATMSDAAEEPTEHITTMSEALDDLFSRASAAGSFAESVNGALGIVSSSMSDAINEVVRGEKTMGEAMEALAVRMLASIGEFLVGEGVKNLLVGLGRTLTSYSTDATGPGLIALGGAQLVAGVGLGAAGAAAAPGGGGGGSAEPAAPQDNRDVADRGNSTVVIQYTQPIPDSQAGRTVNDSLKAAERRGLVRQ